VKKYESLSNDQKDLWWDEYLSIGPETLVVKKDNDFTVVKLRFTCFFTPKKYVPPRVREIILKAINDLCGLPRQSSDHQYLDAFGLACCMKDFATAKRVYDLMEDKAFIGASEIPKSFLKWFQKETKMSSNAKNAVERAGQMMRVPMKDLPPIALDYAKRLSSQVGFCGEVLLTAWAVYAQIVEGLPCDDELYTPTQDAIDFYKEKGYTYKGSANTLNNEDDAKTC
jgi:hypothetical protein